MLKLFVDSYLILVVKTQCYKRLNIAEFSFSMTLNRILHFGKYSSPDVTHNYVAIRKAIIRCCIFHDSVSLFPAYYIRMFERRKNFFFLWDVDVYSL